jgi:hypothetical protein
MTSKIHNIQHKGNSTFQPLFGDDRLKILVSLFKGVTGSTKRLSITTLQEVFDRIRDPENEKLKSFAEQVKLLRAQGKKQYQEFRDKEAIGFIIGDYPVRKNDAVLQYIPLLGFDIDTPTDLTPNIAATIKQLSQLDYVFAAFPSTSGAGIRVFIWSGARLDTHKQYYKYIQNKLSTDTGIPIQSTKDKPDREYLDKSTSNNGRVWFFSHVPEDDLFYLNTSSIAVVMPELEKPHTHSTQHKNQPNKNVSKRAPFVKITDDIRVTIAKDRAEQEHSFIDGQRNQYVYAFAAEMRKNNVPISRAHQECASYEQSDFTRAEILKTVESAYREKQVEYNDAQQAKFWQEFNSPEGQSPDQNPPDKEKEKDNTPPPSNNAALKFQELKKYIFGKWEVRFNEVAIRFEARQKGTNKWEELNINDLYVELLEQGHNGLDAKVIPLLRSSQVPTYDPINKYFEELPAWTEGLDPDYISELASYVKVQDRQWFNTQFKKMFVRTVACGIGLIPFNKHCFTLKGAQNDGKSWFIRFLCPPALKHYITEYVELSKDGQIALASNFIINLDELASFTKNDIKQIKKFITTDSAKVRPPFGKVAEVFNRKASFFASTNDNEFLTDVTGNVRWLVFEIEGIQHDDGGPNGYNQNIDMDKVWSQAYALLKSGYKFQLTKEEIKYSEKINSSFMVVSFEQELIQEIFTPAEKGTPGAEFFTSAEIAKEIDGKLNRRISEVAIGRALTALGFRKCTSSIGRAYSVYGYWAIKGNLGE